MHLWDLKHALNSSIPIKKYKYFSTNSFEKKRIRSLRIHNVNVAGFIIKSRNIFHHLCTHTRYGCFVINMEHYHAMLNGTTKRFGFRIG